MDLWPCVGLRGDRFWVGEPGPLSPEDRERFKEDRLRLVWSRDACLVIFLNRDVLFLLRDVRHVQLYYIKTSALKERKKSCPTCPVPPCSWSSCCVSPSWTCGSSCGRGRL